MPAPQPHKPVFPKWCPAVFARPRPACLPQWPRRTPTPHPGPPLSIRIRSGSAFLFSAGSIPLSPRGSGKRSRFLLPPAFSPLVFSVLLCLYPFCSPLQLLSQNRSGLIRPSALTKARFPGRTGKGPADGIFPRWLLLPAHRPWLQK